MGTAAKVRAATRAEQYQGQIEECRAAGDYVGALRVALAWLQSELSKVQRRRPQHAPEIYRQATDGLAGLAAQIPKVQPSKGGRS